MVTGDGSFFRQDLLPIYKYHAIICIRVREITFVTLCNPNHTICTRINAFCSTIGAAVNFCVTLSGYINSILCIAFKFRTRTANVRHIRDTNCIFRVGIHHTIRNPNCSIILCKDCGCGCVCSIWTDAKIHFHRQNSLEWLLSLRHCHKSEHLDQAGLMFCLE